MYAPTPTLFSGGRKAGRGGGEGHCLAFYAYKDIEKLEKFMSGKPLAEQEIGMALLSDMVAYKPVFDLIHSVMQAARVKINNKE